MPVNLPIALHICNIWRKQMKKIYIYPSILSADFANLGKEVKLLKEAGASGLHVDIMDGHFVKNISLGVPVVESLQGCGLVLDVHLMLTNPLNFIEIFAKAGANSLTFHVECFDNLEECILRAKSFGCKVGLAIKPFTSVDAVEPFLTKPKFASLVDLIVVMTVEPGFAGQVFKESMLLKVEQIRNLSSSVHIAVDGGVNFKNAGRVVAAGADWLVAGSTIFNSSSYAVALQKLKFGSSSVDE